jgi:hypothetical protein
MTARSLVRHALSALALLAIVAVPAAAQGKGSKGGKASSQPMAAPTVRTSSAKTKPMAAPTTGRSGAKAKPASEARGKQRVTRTEAVDVSRRVLVEHGYTVSRVERVGDTQVIYYYRGNNGRGKGRGPLQRMVVRPSAERFVFEGAPADVKRAVTLRLQF